MVTHSGTTPLAGLDELVTAVRAVVNAHADWRQTARLVARELKRRLPSFDVLTPEQRIGDPDGYRTELIDRSGK